MTYLRLQAAPPIVVSDRWAIVNRFAQVGQSTVPEGPPTIARQLTGEKALKPVSSRAQPLFRRSEGSCAESSRGRVEIHARSLAPLVKNAGLRDDAFEVGLGKS